MAGVLNRFVPNANKGQWETYVLGHLAELASNVAQPRREIGKFLSAVFYLMTKAEFNFRNVEIL